MQGKAKLSHGSMTASLQRILFVIAAALVAADLVWGICGHFRADVFGYGRLALLGLALLGAGMFYQVRRREPAIAAMFLGSSFLVFFSAGANLLNNYLLTVAGSRIDAQLDAADRALGFDWYRMMLAMADHPLINGWLFRIYNLALPEIALVVITLACTGKVDKTYRFCIAVAAGALITIFLWALHPAFGAMSLYTLPPDVVHKLVLSLTCEFGKAQVELLRNGPGYITLDGLHGSLIGFPSYHGALALILTWYARNLPRLFWPLLIVNAVVLLSTPVQGGHHLVDVIAAFPVAGLAIFLSRLRESAERSVKPAAMVNKAENLNISTGSTAFFRASAEQTRANVRRAIKSKLSRVS
jgi:hypothetical protein